MHAKLLLVVLLVTGLSPSLGAADDPVGPLAERRSVVVHDALVGTWRTRIGDRSLAIRLADDGSMELDARSGRWQVLPSGLLAMTVGDSEERVTAAFVNGQLSLSGGGLPQAMAFTRDPALSEFMIGWFGLEATSVVQRGMRLFAIAVWIVGAHLALAVLQWAGHWVIWSQWGPFRFIFSTRPQRASTLLSLVLNTCKYLVYGIGLGFVLNTFDVDYTTYLASLSVIGLAIGFGSQGLVQDMVTGIFIILEGQFHVGDIVEMSGQIGRVEEMGLRMTRLRTILGQVVTIPNRSIATVARYGEGLRVSVSLTVPTTAVAEQVQPMVEAAVHGVARQFPAAVLAVSPPSTLTVSDDQTLLLLPVLLWPGQQSVLDQHLLPRLKQVVADEAFGQASATVAWHFSDQPQPGGQRQD